MNLTIAGWVVIGLLALTWEMLGVFGVGGIWPLTHLVWTAEKEDPSVASLIVILSVVGFPAWLTWHFLFQRH